jgi:hypothetical protein
MPSLISVLKPGPNRQSIRDPADPGLESAWVEAKTHLEIGPVKPG